MKRQANGSIGEYQDRRNLDKIDCSKTIWILATNALDATIENFCKINERLLHGDNESEKMRLMKALSKQLKADLVTQFDASGLFFLPGLCHLPTLNAHELIGTNHRPYLGVYTISPLLASRTSRHHPQIPP